MSKWTKNTKPLTEQFIQNQQRRRQMIIQASKRRRQKEKKLQQLNENMKKNQQQALQKHKQQKQQAYTKYLKNNMHDKYEQIKRNQKMQEETKRSVSKWKKKDNSQNKNIQGLDLQKSHGKQNKSIQKLNTCTKIQPNKKGVENKKVIEREFQKQWGLDQIQQIIGSKLIDSLDLDIDTIERGKQISHKINQVKHQNDSKPPIEKDEVQQLKKLIGYDSMLVSIDQITNKQKFNREKAKQPQKQKQKKKQQKKQVNQQQTFNNLKHKKQAKILQWANNNIVEQVDDLFSNCSSNRNSLLNKNNAKQNKGSKKMLQPIPEKKSLRYKSIQKQKQVQKQKPSTLNKHTSACSSNQLEKRTKSNVAEKIVNQSKQSQQKNKFSKQKEQRILSDKNIRKDIQVNKKQQRSISKQKIKQNQAALQKQRQKSLQKIKERRFTNQKPSSAEKQKKPVQQQKPQIPKTQQPFRIQKAPPVPPIPKPAYTVATHQQYFDVESFIKFDLLQINQEQRKLQQQIRNIHINNKQKIKQIQKKHDIRTNYRNTTNLINKLENNYYEQEIGYAQQYNNQLNEDLIQNSLQKLDDLLIKRDIQSRQKTNIQQDYSSYKNEQKSIINPFSKPQELHKQILQLAQNISKFQNEPDEEVKGYGYQRKMKKKEKVKQQITQQLSESRNVEPQAAKRPTSTKRIIQKIPNPPVLEYSRKNSEIIEVNLQQKYYDPQDSLETINKQKIQVNQKLRNMLFDD